MPKYLAISVSAVFSLCTLGMAAQVASGNVAESSHPQADVLRAQNPHIHRTVEGCITQEGSEYALNARHIGIIHLSATGDMLNQHVGQRVKVRGNLTPITVQDADEETTIAPPVANSVREMTVERIENVSGSCPMR